MNFLKKYDKENVVKQEWCNGKFSEMRTFENIEFFMEKFEDPKFSEDDKDFVADLSKFIKIVNDAVFMQSFYQFSAVRYFFND